MPIPRPKILTRFTVPTGGADFVIDVSVSTQFDTTLTATVPAGNYYVAWDNQDDDLLHVLADLLTAEIETAFSVTDNEQVAFSIDNDGFVTIHFVGSTWAGTAQDVRLRTTTDDILKRALGIPNFWGTGKELTGSDNPSHTFEWRHGFGWYAPDDGLLREHDKGDMNEFRGVHSMSWAGRQRGVEFGEVNRNVLSLQFLPLSHVWSGGFGYERIVANAGTASNTIPPQPAEPNMPLESWWHECKSGNPFRVYYDGALIDTARANDSGTMTGTSSTFILSSGKTYDDNINDGALVYIPDFFSAPSNVPMRSFVDFSSSTSLRCLAPHSDTDARFGTNGTQFYVFRHTYQEYQIDMSQMRSFEPEEIPVREEFDIDIPLVRFVS